MTDTTVADPQVWADRELTEAQKKNRASAELIPFGESGVTPQTFAAAVDFAKMMSQARGVVGPHLVGQPAACLAIIDLAAKFQMSAYMLATRSLVVNGILSFDGQGIMAIMNKWLPLAKDEHGNKTRLKYRFEGERAEWTMEEVDELDRNDMPTGKKTWVKKMVKPSSRKVFVTGRMEGEADILEYESPPVALINNKKSPLWQEDEDQQLIYWSSRRWQRRHWPEGLLGIYDPEEAAVMHVGAENAKLIEQETRAQGLIERLAQRNGNGDQAHEGAAIREGFSEEHAHRETNGNGHHTVDDVVQDPKPETLQPAADAEKAEGDKTRKPRKKAAAKATVDEAVKDAAKDHDEDGVVLPKNPAEWRVHALAWIAQAEADPKIKKADMQKKWDGERSLRNACGITEEFRDQVQSRYMDVFHAKPE